MKAGIKTFALLLPLVLSGCDDSNDLPCPENGEQFWRHSLDSYFERHPEMVKNTPYELQPGSRYDSHTNWWIVPFDIGSKRLQALLSCDGHLEISGR